MKCFDEDEIKSIKQALKCELRKNKKSKVITEDEILEKVEHFKCPDKIVSVDEIKKLPLKERIRFARMIR